MLKWVYHSIDVLALIEVYCRTLKRLDDPSNQRDAFWRKVLVCSGPCRKSLYCKVLLRCQRALEMGYASRPRQLEHMRLLTVT